MTWTPPTTGALEVVDLGPSWRPRLEGFVDLSGVGRDSSLTSVQHGSSGTCIDTTGAGSESYLPVADAGRQQVKFGYWGTVPSLTLLSGAQTPYSLGYAFLTSGPQLDEPAPTRCGGPLPADFMPILPVRTVALAALSRGRTTIDLSGTVRFSAHGLSGTARSTLVLHVARLRLRKTSTRLQRAPVDQDNREITIHYQVVRVTGSVAVGVTSDASTCAAFAACGLSGTVTVRPDGTHGHGDVIAYDSANTSTAGLRRAAGLAPGRVPRYAQVYGLASWTTASGTVSSSFERDGAPVCRDAGPVPVAAVELAVTGGRVTAVFGSTDLALLSPARDLLRTRCPGPVMPSLASQGLASAVFPVQRLGQPTLTLHLSTGTTLAGPGFSWHSRPNLTIVLRRTSITQQLIPSFYFET